MILAVSIIDLNLGRICSVGECLPTWILNLFCIFSAFFFLEPGNPPLEQEDREKFVWKFGL